MARLNPGVPVHQAAHIPLHQPVKVIRVTRLIEMPQRLCMQGINVHAQPVSLVFGIRPSALDPYGQVIQILLHFRACPDRHLGALGRRAFPGLQAGQQQR